MSKCPSRKSGGIGCGEHGERQAQAWLAQGLKAVGIKAADLENVKGSDARKVLLADLL